MIVRVGVRFRKKDITLKEALFWSLLWLGVALVVLYPKLTDRLASAIGLQSAKGIDLVVYLAVALVFYLVFRLFVRLEKMERIITKVVRAAALKDNDKSGPNL